MAWLFIAGYAVFGIWWFPLTGQSKWTAFWGAISAASFFGVALTFALLFNKQHLFRKGWSVALNNKARRSLEGNDTLKVELLVGSGEAQTRYVAFSDSSLFLMLEHNRTYGAEFPFNETSVEIGSLYRYFQIRPALRLKNKSLGDVPAYIFKADPALLFGVYALITSKQSLTPPVKSRSKKILIPMALVAGMLLTFTFGLWRVTTITHPEVTHPVGIINSNQAGLYELPTTGSKLISKLEVGEEVLVISNTDNWYYVLRSSEQTGYVPKGLINIK